MPEINQGAGQQWCSLHDMQVYAVYPVLGKVTFKSNALQYCVTP